VSDFFDFLVIDRYVDAVDVIDIADLIYFVLSTYMTQNLNIETISLEFVTIEGQIIGCFELGDLLVHLLFVLV
jgi:hypothetical protein